MKIGTSQWLDTCFHRFCWFEKDTLLKKVDKAFLSFCASQSGWNSEEVDAILVEAQRRCDRFNNIN